MARDETKNAGFALAAVLGFLMLVAALLTPFAVSSRVRGLTAANTFETQRLSLAASAINSRLAAHFTETAASSSDYPQPERCAIGQFDIAISVREQHALVDLNYASPPLLVAGLKALELGDTEATAASDEIRAFRSVASFSGISPSTDTVFADGYKHGPFEDVVELQEIPSLRAYSLATLRGYFTVHSKSGQVSGHSIDPALSRAMRSLGMSPLEGASASRPILRISTTIRAGVGAGASDGVFELGDRKPKLLVSENRMMMPIDTEILSTCSASFWPIVRSLVSRGLGA